MASNRRIYTYPTGSSSLDSWQKVHDFYSHGRYIHNGGFRWDKNRTVTVENASNLSVSSDAKNYTGNGTNPFYADYKLEVTGQSYDHSYGGFFQFGSDDEKMYLPNIYGLFCSMKATTTDGVHKQEPNIKDIYLGYKKDGYIGNPEKVWRLPFNKDSNGNVCRWGQSVDKYAVLSSSERDRIVNNNWIFTSVYVRFYIDRDGAIAKTPRFTFWNVCPIMHRPSGEGRFCIPRERRVYSAGAVRYI